MPLAIELIHELEHALVTEFPVEINLGMVMENCNFRLRYSQCDTCRTISDGCGAVS
jgi:hypothetical protein